MKTGAARYTTRIICSEEMGALKWLRPGVKFEGLLAWIEHVICFIGYYKYGFARMQIQRRY